MGGVDFRDFVCVWLVCCANDAKIFDCAFVKCVGGWGVDLYGTDRWVDDSVFVGDDVRADCCWAGCVMACVGVCCTRAKAE